MGEMQEYQYVLVGGGVACVRASMGIRELDPEGTILIVRGEECLPYDRPPLSKGILLDKATPEDAESKDPSYYPDKKVDLKLGTWAVEIDPATKTVRYENGDGVRYEKLLLGLGARPRKPEMPGIELPGVHLLREIGDSLAIRQSIRTSKRAVFVGAGYIGMEVAAACLQHGLEATIVDPAPHPWGKFASPLTGGFLRSEFEKLGARFHLGKGVRSIQGDSKVESVVLDDGTTIEADMVVVGVGVEANVDLAKETGLDVDEKHGVVVDERLKTSDSSIWAAGDIAAFIDPVTGTRTHAEHHLNANWQGLHAGKTMAGANDPYDKVAYFFSDMGDLHMILRGSPSAGRSIRHLGEVEAGEFIELYADDEGRLVMGIAFSHDESRLDPISDSLEKAIQERRRASEVDEATLGIDADRGLG